MNEDIIARWVAAEMVAEGVVTRKDGVLIVSASGRDFMIEIRALDLGTGGVTNEKRLRG